MVSDTCLASAFIYNKGSKKRFTKLSLDDFPGENLSALATTALKLINTMNTGYTLYIKLGSNLLKNLYINSSSLFKRNIHNELRNVKKMETKYTLKDPKLLKEYP